MKKALFVFVIFPLLFAACYNPFMAEILGLNKDKGLPGPAIPPEEMPVQDRWQSSTDETSTATIDHFSVDDKGLITVTIGGSPESNNETDGWGRWKASVDFLYTGNIDTSYIYEFEAWTETGSRTLNVQYYWDEETGEYKLVERTISSQPARYMVIGQNLPKDGIRALSFQCGDQLGTFYLRVVDIREAGPEDHLPEKWPDAYRWSVWANPESTASITHSVADDGVCTITVGGEAYEDRWYANASYKYTARANTAYEYEFEAWTQSGSRTVNVQYFNDWADTGVRGETINITSTRATYTIEGDLLPKGGEREIEFQCADQTGTFYIKILSITPVPSAETPDPSADIFNVASADEWNAAVSEINERGEGSYLINVVGDFSMNGVTSNTFNATGIDATIDGRNHAIALIGQGSLLSIGANQTVTMRGLTLRGVTDNDASLVCIGGGTFSMTGGTVSSNTTFASGGGVYVGGNGKFNMTGGSVTDNTARQNGGGVFVESGGSFTMSGSAMISNNGTTYANGGGVYVEGGEFAMSGDAEVSGNKVGFSGNGGTGGGVYVNGGTFTMSGSAKVSGNRASSPAEKGHGGGVYVYEGTFTIKDSAEVSNNTANGNGGGVYVIDGGAFAMSGGKVSGNEADNGGGVSVENGTFTMSGGTVGGSTAAEGNKAAIDGGGVYVHGGEFTMSGGQVSGNEASGSNEDAIFKGYGGGVCVSGSGSVFTMNDGTIGGTAANIATSGGGGVCVLHNGEFTMTGGTIIGNNALSGGGVSVGNSDSFATFTMEGGTVSGNTVTYSGGGVSVSSNGSTFTMTVGAIIGNNAQSGGGVSIGTGGLFTMNGSGTNVPKVSGNTATNSGGGVSVSQATFNISNGTVYGSGEGANSNTANGGGAALAKGDATAQYGLPSSIPWANIPLTGSSTTSREDTIKVVNGVLWFEMVLVPGGEFQMGYDKNSSEGGNNPYFQLTQFYIGKYEVTQEQYQAVMGSNPSNFTSNPDTGETQRRRPVEKVSWYDAVEFCNKLSELEGLTPYYTINKTVSDANNTGSDSLKWLVTLNTAANGYRLPTEAQWEYAAKGGLPPGTYFPNIYSGSDDPNEVAWYLNKDAGTPTNNKTHEVGKLAPNELGIYDMSGNVYEWCWDWYAIYYSESPDTYTNPVGPSSGDLRVGRGGSWDSPNTNYLRSSARLCSNAPDFKHQALGFRIVRP